MAELEDNGKTDVEFICCQSMYGYFSKKPIVKITYIDKELKISPQEARDLALNLLQCAEGAETDAFLFEKLGLDELNAAKLIMMRRAYRSGIPEKETK